MTPLPRIVLIGDSITDAGRDRSDRGSLGTGYAALIADALAGEAEVVNVGISGDRAVDLEARWTDDVDALEPAVLSVYVGVNDTWRRFDRGDATSAEDFEATYRRLLSSDAARSARLVLVEPFLLPVRAEQEEWRGDLDAKRDVVARLAGEAGAAFVPLHAILSAEAAHVGPAALAADGVHPTPAGAALIARAWLEAYRRAG
ncbi:SGNH/GDSL hydrolase family protein [Microbacterium sp. NPDC055683]